MGMLKVEELSPRKGFSGMIMCEAVLITSKRRRDEYTDNFLGDWRTSDGPRSIFTSTLYIEASRPWGRPRSDGTYARSGHPKPR